jgi:hypothetical protein
MVAPAAIHVDEFRKEMISHKKACTIVQHCGRNAPKLEITNPRAVVRKYSLKQIKLKKKSDWHEVLDFMKTNPQTLMSVAMTPNEPEQILQLKHTDKLYQSASFK